MDQFLQAQILKAELTAIDSHFTDSGLGDIAGILLLKQSFILVANFYDFEITIRKIYKDHPELNEQYKEFKQECKFAKYLRNKFVGHLKQDLVNKALEWNPEIRMLLDGMSDPKCASAVNLLVLETAINTYVDSDQKHKIFPSETDLNYPDDNVRFLKFLTLIIRSSIAYLEEYTRIRQLELQAELDKSKTIEGMLDLGKKAGQTEFEFIRK
ncbi:MAG: hypothetical protein GY928_25190 [Colwellia sp.]|nr:hypothetical protein [Colwellia sp.]